jgi:uncharacterized protein
MTLSALDVRISHESTSDSSGRFVAHYETREIGELTYRVSGERVIANHTFVESEYRQARAADALVRGLVDWLKTQTKPLEPRCSYVAAWFARHPEHQSLLAHD